MPRSTGSCEGRQAGSYGRGSQRAPGPRFRSSEPEQVNVHDFPDKDLGKAIPYGIYDVGDNTGWVTVGTDHDTNAFAVATLRTWWATIGQHRYPGASQLLICAVWNVM